MAAIRFLTTLAKSVHSALFQDDAVLQQARGACPGTLQLLPSSVRRCCSSSYTGLLRAASRHWAAFCCRLAGPVLWTCTRFECHAACTCGRLMAPVLWPKCAPSSAH